MRKYIGFLLILLVVAGIVFFIIQRRPEPAIVPEPAIEFPQLETIGRSVQGREIQSFTYGSGQREVVLVGGIHGGYEWNTVLLAYQLMDYFKKYPEAIPVNIKLTIIPDLNPDGVYRVTGMSGRFALTQVSEDKTVLASGRFNGNNVDLNRNFDCNWQPEAKWQSKTVSAGKSAFSEPESLAIKNFTEKNRPEVFVFFHSQANGVFPGQCDGVILPETLNISDVYSKASGYPVVKSFDSYAVTGDVTDWLKTLSIPGISIELKTHETIEFEENLLGIKAVIEYISRKP